MTAKSSTRIVALDLFRYLTVTFALVSHIIGHHYIFSDDLAGGEVFGKALTRTATPALLILFGMMGELVYTRRYRLDPLKTFSGLVYRSFLCYLAFVVLSVCVLFFEDGNATKFIGAIILVSPSGGYNIFKLYALFLLIMPLLIVPRIKYGVSGLLFLPAIAWLVFLLLLWNAPEAPFPLQHIAGLLFGIGDTWGPSILSGLALVSFGMLMANAFFSHDRLVGSRLAVVVVFALSILALGWQAAQTSTWDVAVSIADSSWRDQNDPRYYAFGVVACAALFIFSFLGEKVLPASLTFIFQKLGSVTLFYFFVGNVLISVMPRFQPSSPALSVATIVAYLGIVGCITFWWATVGKDMPITRRINSRGGQVFENIVRRFRPREALTSP